MPNDTTPSANEPLRKISRAEFEQKEKSVVSNSNWMNKHKIPGKHKLKYDSIFKGKKEEQPEEEHVIGSNHSEGFEIDRSSFEWQSKYDFEEYNRLKQLKQQIYDIIVEKTDINLKANRRKPGRADFNRYYEMLIDNLNMQVFSYSELFVELAFYFSESTYNMFKLLDQKWGTKIVKELSSKYNVDSIDGVDFL